MLSKTLGLLAVTRWMQSVTPETWPVGLQGRCAMVPLLHDKVSLPAAASRVRGTVGKTSGAGNKERELTTMRGEVSMLSIAADHASRSRSRLSLE